MRYDQVNGEPWRSTMARLTGTNAADWGVTLGTYVPPKCLYHP
jgi:hypothetical protein